MGRVRIAVVGGGVVGITTATRVQTEIPNVHVTVFSEDFTPDTTGDGAAGIWGPFLDQGTPPDKIWRWSKETHDLLESLWKEGKAPEAGVALCNIVAVFWDPEAPPPFWKDIVYGFRLLTAEEMTRYSPYRRGWEYTTFICECTAFLPYLTKKFLNAGGELEKVKIEDLSLLQASHDIIINCTGIGSSDLVPDPLVHPLRGHLIRVEAPWIKRGFFSEEKPGESRETYWIPNMETVALGGTFQAGNWSRKPDINDSNFIASGAAEWEPSFKGAKVLYEWVGLRPGRTGGVRLEWDNDHYQVLHNYGHAGSGITYSWGCAKEVVQQIRMRIPRSRL